LLAAEYDGGFQDEHAADAHEARKNNDGQHGYSGAGGDLPEQREAAQVEDAFRGLKERRRHSDTDRESDHGDRHGLQENHSRNAPVGDADGFESSELLQILEREDVKGLSGDDRADDERDRDGDSEIERNAGVMHVVPDGLPAELAGGGGMQAHGGFDA